VVAIGQGVSNRFGHLYLTLTRLSADGSDGSI
jgi:hypothetical protein